MANVRFVGLPRPLLYAAVAEMPGWRILGERIFERAKALCPVSDNEDDGPHLVDQLELRFISGVDPRILIGCSKDPGHLKFRYVVDGTDPHPIDALGPYSLHNAQTDEYFGPHVEHPGTDPNNFPVEAMKLILHDSASKSA